MLNKYRNRYQKQNESLGKFFSKIPLTPNAWTLISLIAILASAYNLYNNNYPYALILFAISGACDAIDGAVARYQNKATKKGAYLDTIIDRYVEFIILFTLYLTSKSSNAALLTINETHWLILAIFGSLMTTYSKAAAKEKEITISGGLLERAERILFILAIIIAKWQMPTITLPLIATFAILTNITAIQRILLALKISTE